MQALATHMCKQARDTNAQWAAVAAGLFSAQASYFAYEPVLKSLQLASTVPMSDLTLQYNELPSPTLPHCRVDYESLPTSVRDAVQSDESQQAAVRSALTQPLVLIQGPPGTGKTYAGVWITKAIMHYSQTGQQMLVLCYTNHALDSFLEALLDAGLPEDSFVRLGGSKKTSERLVPRLLRNLDESKFSPSEASSYWALKDQRSSLFDELSRVQRVLQTNSRWTPGVTCFLDVVVPFLSDYDFEAREELEVYIQQLFPLLIELIFPTAHRCRLYSKTASSKLERTGVQPSPTTSGSNGYKARRQPLPVARSGH